MAAVQGTLSGVHRTHSPAWIAATLQAAGIAADQAHQTGARVTGEQYIALVCHLIDRLEDEALGLMSRPLRPGSFRLLVRSTLGANSLGGALHRLAQGLDVLLPDLAVQVVATPDRTGLALSPRPKGIMVPNFLYELLARVCWRLLVWLQGRRLSLVQLDFCFSRPPYAAIYPEIFPTPIRFDQSASIIWFPTVDLAARLCRDASALRQFLRHAPANVILPQLPDRTMRTRLLALFRRNTPHWPDLANAATALHLSISTLQRHLAAEGTSFQQVKDHLRRDLAIARLTTSDVPLACLANELGFADSAAFQRAFKSWTGSAPGLYRRSASIPQPPALLTICGQSNPS